MTSRLSLVVVFLAMFGAPVASAAPEDRKAAAAALFENGIRDVQAGKTERGCDELAQSVATWPDSGAKGALAECDTTLGRLSDAWELWRDLATSAPSAELRDDAAKNAAALDRRLVRVVIQVRGAVPATLVVTINGKPAGAFGHAERRTEPGTLVVVATSTDTAPWTRTFHAKGGTTLAIEIPLLPSSNVVRQRSRGRLVGLAFLGAGVAGIGVGAVFGITAYSDWRSASDACGGNTGHCKSAGFASAQSDLDHARHAATSSTIYTGLGAAVTAVGLIIYLYSAPKTESASAWRFSPQVGSQSVGLALSRSLP
jgi:hypothetical protein